MPLSEETLWSVALQLIAALHAAHLAGLAVRLLDLSHVLVTEKEYVRISGAGLLDVTRPDTTRTVGASQHEDLQALGRLLVNLVCASTSAAASPQALSKSMVYVSSTYSADFNQLLMLLLSAPHPSVHDAAALCSGRMTTRLAQVQWHNDALHHELAKEMENGRLLRLLVKLNTVADRPTLGDDTSWGEHNDRYLLRLFRDHLFNQVPRPPPRPLRPSPPHPPRPPRPLAPIAPHAPPRPARSTSKAARSSTSPTWSTNSTSSTRASRASSSSRAGRTAATRARCCSSPPRTSTSSSKSRSRR